MAHKNVIVIQKAGLQINPAYSSRVLKDYTSYMGAALVSDEKLLIARTEPGKVISQADITGSTEAFGTSDIVFTFGKADKDTLPEDKQPFEILKNNDGVTIMCAFLDGGFQGYSVVKSIHSDEYHCVQEFIIPKMKKLYKASGQDLKLLLEELNDDITKKDFCNAWTDRGNITFLAEVGPPITLSSNNVMKQSFNWGWTSNTMGYVEQTTAPPAEATKPLTLFEQLKAKAAGKVSTVGATTIVDVTGPSKPTELPPEQTTAAATAALVEAEGDWEWYQIPAEGFDKLTNRDKIKIWNDEVGYKPEGYKLQTTKVKRKKGTKIGLLAPLAATNVTVEQAVEANAASPADPVVDATGTASPEPVKDVTPTHVSMDNLPLISPKSRLKIKTEWEKNAEVQRILGEDHRAIFDPKKLQELEDTYAGFMDGQLGRTLEETANWEFFMFKKLGEVDVNALAVLAFNLRNEMLKTKLLVPGNKLLIPANKSSVPPVKVAM